MPKIGLRESAACKPGLWHLPSQEDRRNGIFGVTTFRQHGYGKNSLGFTLVLLRDGPGATGVWSLQTIGQLSRVLPSMTLNSDPLACLIEQDYALHADPKAVEALY